ncbi:zinc finger CCCH domain-containing protein 18 [Frankliniella occidentalis]|uniref:Zinc finger CCCH domain-containing protein 18 n=1 Tax=Frankliniella occidentalis TaxID=133901 RepID=A0A6J1SGI8_FRAOC|nr:zinc finger CCCH domain-containing protein 18 [Frankliniella occidentalis]XP_052124998.1 zinc finger CCCH domain-containing protein 18 [Frankliniella occidentalis]
MDSENSSDGELNVKSGGYASSDEERSVKSGQKSPRSPPDSPPDSPPTRQSPPSSPNATRRSRSKSPSPESNGVLPEKHSPSGSPSGHSSSRSPSRRSPSGSPSRRSPSGSPSRRSPSGSSSRRSPSGSPSPSRSPSKRSPSHSPKHVSRESPRSQSAASGPSPGRQSPSSSPGNRRQTPSPHQGSPVREQRSDRESYSRRTHGKKSKKSSGGEGNASDGSDDDGNSSISSSSSFGAASESKKRPVLLENGDQKEKGKFEPHKAEDLSDVSDLDSANGDGSLDSLSDDEGSRKKKSREDAKKPASPVRTTQTSNIRKDIVSHSDEMEQLDFEAEEPQSKEDKEDGECGETAQAAQPSQTDPEPSTAKSEGDDGELNNEEVEEGEITDEDENRPEETEPRPICRFYNRGQCTWGSSCRFLHPGVTDKGNYTMFDMVRPLVPTNGPPMYGSMMDPYRPPLERPMMAPVGPLYTSRKEEAPAVESAWERGLRTAKEMMRKASKRKETDMDFEEKKMNLSLGQDELDKENDYYTRPASPALEDDLDRWNSKEPPEGKHHRMVVTDRYDAMDPYYGHHREGRERWARGHYDDVREPYGREHLYDSRHPGPHHESHMAYRAHMHTSGHHEGYYPDKYEKKKKSHTVREVIVQHSRKPSYKDDKPSGGPHKGGRGDEWADPWMRSKSPTARKSRPSRRQSYSSGSSYSSSRSSRSSYSSYSRSGSRSRSRSKSRSASGSRSRSRSPPHPSQSLRRTGAAPGRPGKGGSPAQSRQRRNPPDPRARGPRVGTPDDKRSGHVGASASVTRKPRPPSPGATRKSGTNPVSTAGPGRVAGAKVRSSKPSRSSSSESSGSSSDSSDTSSMGSSSSSRDPTPPPKPKTKIQMDERLMAQSTKVKAMDALKLSGQKQQIKLTLKTPGSNPQNPSDDPRRSAVVAGKKRTAETTPPPETAKASAAAKPPVKKTTSRREELLKQLKAVEDAIARKRSKIT